MAERLSKNPIGSQLRREAPETWKAAAARFEAMIGKGAAGDFFTDKSRHRAFAATLNERRIHSGDSAAVQRCFAEESKRLRLQCDAKKTEKPTNATQHSSIANRFSNSGTYAALTSTQKNDFAKNAADSGVDCNDRKALRQLLNATVASLPDDQRKPFERRRAKLLAPRGRRQRPLSTQSSPKREPENKEKRPLSLNMSAVERGADSKTKSDRKNLEDRKTTVEPVLAAKVEVKVPKKIEKTESQNKLEIYRMETLNAFAGNPDFHKLNRLTQINVIRSFTARMADPTSIDLVNSFIEEAIILHKIKRNWQKKFEAPSIVEKRRELTKNSSLTCPEILKSSNLEQSRSCLMREREVYWLKWATNEYLVQEGSSITTQEYFEETLKPIFDLSNGVDDDVRTRGCNAITAMIRLGKSPGEVYRACIGLYHQDLDALDGNGETPLTTAIVVGSSAELVADLLRAKVSISQPNKKGHAPLEATVLPNRIEIFELLLNKGADVADISKLPMLKFLARDPLSRPEMSRLLFEKKLSAAVELKNEEARRAAWREIGRDWTTDSVDSKAASFLFESVEKKKLEFDHLVELGLALCETGDMNDKRLAAKCIEVIAARAWQKYETATLAEWGEFVAKYARSLGALHAEAILISEHQKKRKRRDHAHEGLAHLHMFFDVVLSPRHQRSVEDRIKQLSWDIAAESPGKQFERYLFLLDPPSEVAIICEALKDLDRAGAISLESQRDVIAQEIKTWVHDGCKPKTFVGSLRVLELSVRHISNANLEEMNILEKAIIVLETKTPAFSSEVFGHMTSHEISRLHQANSKRYALHPNFASRKTFLKPDKRNTSERDGARSIDAMSARLANVYREKVEQEILDASDPAAKFVAGLNFALSDRYTPLGSREKIKAFYEGILGSLDEKTIERVFEMLDDGNLVKRFGKHIAKADEGSKK